MSDRGGLDVGSAHGEIVIGSDLKGIDQAAKALTGFNSQADKSNKALNTLSKTGAILGGGIAAGLTVAVRSFADFQNEMLAVKAVSGATGEEFTKLSDLAKQIGKDTVFSASEAASALEELAKAGVSIPDILNGAAAGATALAAAAGESIPAAASQIATSLNEFSLSGDQATRVADIFTNAANESAASADSLGEAFKFVGAQAHALNIPIEDVAAAVAALADQGVDGSTAGTSLNAALSALVSPSKKAAAVQKQLGLQVEDNAGNFVGLQSILDQLTKATAGLGDVEKKRLIDALIPEERASRAILLLLNTQTDDAKAAGKSFDDYAKAMRESGTASEQAKTRLSGLSGSFEQLRGSVETMEIEFGENLSPVVKDVADALTSLTNTFTGLGEGTQTAIAAAAATTGGLLLLAAAGAKVITTGRDIKGAWDTVRGKFDNAQKGCSNASGCLESIGTNAERSEGKLRPLLGTLGKLAAFGVVSIGVEIAIDAAVNAVTGHSSQIERIGVFIDQKVADGMKAAGLETIGKALQDNVDAAAANMKGRDIALGLGFTIEQKKGNLDEALNLAIDTAVPGGKFIPDKFIPQVQHADDVIAELGVTVDDVQKRADTFGISFSEALAQIAEEQGKATPEIKAYREEQARANEESAKAAKLAADQAKKTKDGTGAVTGIFSAIKAQLGIQNDANAASGKSAEDLQAQADAEEAAAKEAADLAAKIGGIVTAAEIANGTLRDFGDGVVVLNTGLFRLTDTTAGAVLQMDKFSNIHLSKSNREAEELERTLEHTEQRLAQVDAEVQNNEQDYGMWADRIRLVTDVVGGNTEELDKQIGRLQNGEITQEEFNASVEGSLGTFTKLDALLAQHKITQDEYNAAKAAAIDIIRRSAGGMQDEDAELASNLVLLDKYIKKHDDAAGAVKRLTDDQREFLAVTKSDAVSQFIDDLAKLKAIGAPEDVVTRFIVDSSQADPLIAAFVEDTQLLDGKHVTVVLTAENAPQVLDDLGGIATFAVSLDGKQVTVHVNTEAQALDFAKQNAEALDGKVVTFVFDGDDGPVTKTLEQVRADAGEGATIPVTIKPTLPPGIADPFTTAIINGNAAGATVPPVEAPPPVPITAEDDTQVGVDAAKKTLATVPDGVDVDLTVKGTQAGNTFEAGLAAALAAVPDPFGSIATAAAFDLSPEGHAAGQSFLDGIGAALDGTTDFGAGIQLAADAIDLNDAGRSAGQTFVVGVFDTFAADFGEGSGSNPFTKVADATIMDLSPEGHDVGLTFAEGFGGTTNGEALRLGGVFADVFTQAAATQLGADAQAVEDAAVFDLSPQGDATGVLFGDGLGPAIARGVATAGQTVTDGFASLPSIAASWGDATGANFAVSFINAINALDAAAFNAAFNLAFNAKVGAESGIQAHSPSRVALGLGLNFGQSFVDAIQSKAVAARQAGLSLSQAATLGAQGGFSGTAMRSLFDGRAVSPATFVGRGAVGGGSVLNVGGINVTVHGANDNADVIANRVRMEIVDGIVQLESRRT